MSAVVYADSSALVKLVVREPQTRALRQAVRGRSPLVTSAIAGVEVRRAVRLATLGNHAADAEAMRLLRRCRLVLPTLEVLARAADFASAHVRTLDAIHLASALHVGAGAMLVYDRRLADAAEAAGLEVLAPGAGSG